MTDPLAEQDDTSTPLSPDEREGLIPSYITLRGELNEAEQANVPAANEWAFWRKSDVRQRRAFEHAAQAPSGDVWAVGRGTYRKSQKTIGIEFYRIPTELRKLLDDCRYWVKNNTYPPDEIGARFHHRLVSIHGHPNGQRPPRAPCRRSASDRARPRPLQLGQRQSHRRGSNSSGLRCGAAHRRQPRLRATVRVCQVLRKAKPR